MFPTSKYAVILNWGIKKTGKLQKSKSEQNEKNKIVRQKNPDREEQIMSQTLGMCLFGKLFL